MKHAGLVCGDHTHRFPPRSQKVEEPGQSHSIENAGELRDQKCDRNSWGLTVTPPCLEKNGGEVTFSRTNPKSKAQKRSPHELHSLIPKWRFRIVFWVVFFLVKRRVSFACPLPTEKRNSREPCIPSTGCQGANQPTSPGT